MNVVLLILPSLVLIALGYVLKHHLRYGDDFWAGVERLVFYVLFPPLLLMSVAKAPFTIGNDLRFICVSVGAMLIAVAIAYFSPRLFPKIHQLTHASVFQCGFRFNSYIAFALCWPLLGSDGFALLALLIAVWVPMGNVFAIAALANGARRAEEERREAAREKRAVARLPDDEPGSEPGEEEFTRSGRSLFYTIMTNPLIIATVIGFAWNMLGIPFPDTLGHVLKQMGQCGIVLGLLGIGAHLKFAGLSGHMIKFISWATFQKIVLVPVVAFVMLLIFPLHPVAAQTLILFAALPTGQSCYPMTAAMGGDADSVASVTTMQTLLAMVTMPLFILLGEVLFPIAAASGAGA